MAWPESEYIERLDARNGIYLASLEKFDQLLNYLKETEAQKGWIFRGQANDKWGLVPSLYRDFQNPPPEGVARRHLEKFRVYVRGRIPNTDSWGEQRYWALGRHYGLKTPLLDWSASAFIGLFFAFHEEAGSEYCALYGLNASFINLELCRRISSKLASYPKLKDTFEGRFDHQGLTEEEKEIKIGKTIIGLYDSDLKPQNDEHLQFQDLIFSAIRDFVRLLSPKMGDNPRLLSQRGIFTYQVDARSVEKIIENCITSGKTILLKVRIPSCLRRQILIFLNSMNVNYLSLFPDLEGAARYCNEKLNDEAKMDIRELDIDRIWI
jgi:hypothetical protein